MKNACILVGFLLLISLNACKDEDPTDIYDIVYEVEFQATWSQDNHPMAYTSDAHFSPLVGVSHRSNVFLFEEGLPASEGLRIVAETGATGTMEDELQRLVNQNLGLDFFTGSSFDSPGSDKVQFGVSPTYNTVSIVSMIAPSPDWFVAGRVSLLDPNTLEWFDEVSIMVDTYDAGSDSGAELTSPDNPTDPVEGVSLITDGPLVNTGDSLVRNMGRMVFRRIQ